MKILKKLFLQYFGVAHGIATLGGFLLTSLIADAGFSFGVGFLEGLLNIKLSELVTFVNFSHSLEILKMIFGHMAGGIVIVGLLQFFSQKLSRDLWKEIGWMPCRRSFLVGGILFGAILGFGVLVARYILLGDLSRSSFNPDGLNLLFWSIPSLLLAPVIEETLFRGVLYLGVLNSWGRTWAFGIVTILFSLSHSQYFLNGNFPPLFVFIAYTMSGIATLFLRIQSNSLFPSMAFHCSYNLMGILYLFWRLSPIDR